MMEVFGIVLGIVAIIISGLCWWFPRPVKEAHDVSVSIGTSLSSEANDNDRKKSGWVNDGKYTFRYLNVTVSNRGKPFRVESVIICVWLGKENTKESQAVIFHEDHSTLSNEVDRLMVVGDEAMYSVSIGQVEGYMAFKALEMAQKAYETTKRPLQLENLEKTKCVTAEQCGVIRRFMIHKIAKLESPCPVVMVKTTGGEFLYRRLHKWEIDGLHRLIKGSGVGPVKQLIWDQQEDSNGKRHDTDNPPV